MRVLTLLLWVMPVVAQTYLPHITDPAGSFSTEIVLTNTAATARSVVLRGYSTSGADLGNLTVSVPARGRAVRDPALSFGTSIAYVQIVEGSDDVMVFAEYLAETAGALPAAAGTQSPAAVWHLVPGDWSLAWDGLAVVNLDAASSGVVIHQRSTSGSTLATHALGVLGGGEKRLVVLSAVFNEIAGTYFEVTSSGGSPLVVTALRGNSDATLLWENAAQAPSPPRANHARRLTWNG